jgi:diguanylate cyclase (GGDEF)-like protein
MKYQKLLFFLQNVGRDPSSLMQEDYLTGLKNRRFLLQFLKKQVDWSTLEAHPLSLLVVDIDHFKRINEQYGSRVGDQVLVHVAKILKKAAGKAGVPVLYAGDEFMLLLPDTKKHTALIAAAKLIEYVRENPFFSSDAATEIPITLSIGVATAPDDASGGKELLSQVKNGLYHAKQSGRNRFADVGDVSRQAV